MHTNHFIALFLLCMQLSSSFLHSEIAKEQKAFYAISSLRSIIVSNYIEKHDNFTFNDNDIALLWKRAEKAELFEVETAKLYFYSALANDRGAKNHFSAAEAHLREAWMLLNPYYEVHTPELLTKGNRIQQYLLTKEHPLSKKLRKIFADPHTLDNPVTLEKAGFVTVSERPSGIFVSSHPALEGYLIKAYVHSKKLKLEWTWCFHRCWGASNIRKLIAEKKLKHFSVPDKYIFPFSPDVDVSMITDAELAIGSPGVLVVTDMQLTSREKSVQAWKEATKEQLDELYCILSHGYSSSKIHANIPRTKNKNFACIDTESPHRLVKMENVLRHLSPEGQQHWNYLVKTGGKKTGL